MKSKNLLLASLLALPALAVTSTQAAVKDYNIKYRQAIQEDGRMLHETRRQPYGFRVEIVGDSDGIKAEGSKNGRPYITAVRDERYSVRLYNPLPVRVAVNLTVDGINSITGKPSGISDGSKWMIDPYGYVTIPGWQVSGGESRRFFFTDKPKSYAKWRGDALGQDLAANCGVIGAAYFWNQEELNQYYEQHPIVRYTQHYTPFAASANGRVLSDKAMGAPAPSAAMPEESRSMDAMKDEAQEQAGTGMGERESNPTVQVEFNYNAGMYSIAQAVVIYYGFEEKPVPNPFPAVSYAPEQP